jgi:UDP-3-O-[3-hydroxymyristoyl] glucosamine N-acyltransferase
MQVDYSATDIVSIVEPLKTAGSTTQRVRDIASLNSARPGDLSFLGNLKYKADVAATRASVVLVPPDFTGEPQSDQQFLFVKNPSASLARICARIEQALWPKPPPGVHPTAFVAPSAKVDPSAFVGPLCVVEDGCVIGPETILQGSVHCGRNVHIGRGCWIMPGCVIATGCEIRNRVRLQPGVVLGSDGFGYEFVNGRHEKVPQVGNVVIEDDVEIGANSTIDRARFSRTVVGEGTKIDNLVQVAHNVVIGKHCILCAQVGISGSTTLDDYVVLGGQAGVAGHLSVGKGAKAGGRAGITADVAPGAFVNGHPALPYMLERRLVVLQHRLPELFKRVEILEQQREKASATA